MSRTSLGRRLHSARTAQGFSARALDDRAGLTHGHTWSIEEGQRETITTDTASALAKALGCSLDWLINGEGEGPSANQKAS